MRDARIPNLIPQTTMNATTTTVTGSPLNLLEGYVWNGNYRFGTTGGGLGVEIMASSGVIGNDADGFTIAFKWQTAPDVSGAPGTWTDAGTIGTLAFDETNGWTVDGTLAGAKFNANRAKMSAHLRTYQPWTRMVATATSLTGTATVVVEAYVADGAHPYSDNGLIY